MLLSFDSVCKPVKSAEILEANQIRRHRATPKCLTVLLPHAVAVVQVLWCQHLEIWHPREHPADEFLVPVVSSPTSSGPVTVLAEALAGSQTRSRM